MLGGFIHFTAVNDVRDSDLIFFQYMDNLENVPSFLDFLLGVLVNNTWLSSVFYSFLIWRCAFNLLTLGFHLVSENREQTVYCTISRIVAGM